MEELFKCSECQNLDDNVYELDCCGLIFCEGCQIKHKQNRDTCKRCGIESDFKINHFVNRIVQSFVVKCKYHCGKQCQFQDMKPHLKTCSNREYNCTFDNCLFIGKKDDLMQHLITSHNVYLLCLMEAMNEFDDTIISQQNKRPVGTREKELRGHLFNSPLFIDDEEGSNHSINLTIEERNNSHNSNSRSFAENNAYPLYRRYQIRDNDDDDDDERSEESDIRPQNRVQGFRINNSDDDDLFNNSNASYPNE